MSNQASRLPVRTFPLGDLPKKLRGKASELIELIDRYFGVPGIPFEVICEFSQGGIRHYDLEVPLADGPHAYNMRIPNLYSPPQMQCGFFAERCTGHIR